MDTLGPENEGEFYPPVDGGENHPFIDGNTFGDHNEELGGFD